MINGKLEFFAEREGKAVPVANLWINVTNADLEMFELKMVDGKFSDVELAELCEQLREVIQMVRRT